MARRARTVKWGRQVQIKEVKSCKYREADRQRDEPERERERDALHHLQCATDLHISTHICAPTTVIIASGETV